MLCGFLFLICNAAATCPCRGMQQLQLACQAPAGYAASCAVLCCVARRCALCCAMLLQALGCRHIADSSTGPGCASCRCSCRCWHQCYCCVAAADVLFPVSSLLLLLLLLLPCYCCCCLCCDNTHLAGQCVQQVSLLLRTPCCNPSAADTCCTRTPEQQRGLALSPTLLATVYSRLPFCSGQTTATHLSLLHLCAVTTPYDLTHSHNPPWWPLYTASCPSAWGNPL